MSLSRVGQLLVWNVSFVDCTSTTYKADCGCKLAKNPKSLKLVAFRESHKLSEGLSFAGSFQQGVRSIDVLLEVGKKFATRRSR